MNEPPSLGTRLRAETSRFSIRQHNWLVREVGIDLITEELNASITSGSHREFSNPIIDNARDWYHGRLLDVFGTINGYTPESVEPAQMVLSRTLVDNQSYYEEVSLNAKADQSDDLSIIKNFTWATYGRRMQGGSQELEVHSGDIQTVELAIGRLVTIYEKGDLPG